MHETEIVDGDNHSSARQPRALDIDEILTTETFLVNVIADIEWLMAERGVTKADLARRLDKSEARISQMFNGGRGSNLTLRVLGGIFHALGEHSARITSPTLEVLRGEVSGGFAHPALSETVTILCAPSSVDDVSARMSIDFTKCHMFEALTAFSQRAFMQQAPMAMRGQHQLWVTNDNHCSSDNKDLKAMGL